MHLRSRGSVGVSHLKVRFHVKPSRSLWFLSVLAVWGVIWLLIAFIFFAAGVLVGLAAFKVP